MTPNHPSFAETVSGILSFAARKGERIAIERIHSMLREMGSPGSLLSEIDSCIDGGVPGSLEIERVLQDLISNGVLRSVDDTTVVVEKAGLACIRLSIEIPFLECKRLRSASSIFYGMLREVEKPAQDAVIADVA
jgi:hypothetical protein